MEVVHERCAGMDISKNDAKVCVRTPSKRAGYYHNEVTTYGATTNEVLRLRADLVAAQVTLVVMEATSDYWKPFFFPLQEELNVQLVNAKQAKNIPGRKSDVSDARWLAELAAHGLLRASFVPEEPLRQLRDLTRTRKHYAEEQNREYSRLEKSLEDAGIKLSNVVSRLTLVSVRSILDALVAGQRDPHVLADLVQPTLRKKNLQLIEALTGRFTDHHAFMVTVHPATIDYLGQAITDLEDRIEELMEPFRPARDAIMGIPGVSTTVADGVIAEIGTDMNVFATPGQLASWAGVAPGQNESAGRVKSTRTTHGNHYLRAYLGIAVLSIAKSKHTYLGPKYRRLASRRGKLKAVVAIEHTLLDIIWNMLHDGVAYTERGADYYEKLNPQRTIDRALKQLTKLGLTVTITPTAVA
ncbi:IS110 family RNA-guided transposase [Rathayibacter soli]|uniref:IS110 family transposase n=1 Tax=Rathayibacter soli TaxID=3144168 RepID=UPI0027E3D21C|nr:IS110 family transposase [Glaciibacter superstes]